MGLCGSQLADHVAVSVGVDETITRHRLGREWPQRKTVRSFPIKSMDYFVLISGVVGISVSDKAVCGETADFRRAKGDVIGARRADGLRTTCGTGVSAASDASGACGRFSRLRNGRTRHLRCSRQTTAQRFQCAVFVWLTTREAVAGSGPGDETYGFEDPDRRYLAGKLLHIDPCQLARGALRKL